MEHSNLSPLDISGPAHVVSERWRKWRRSFHFYVTGKGLRDPPQLRALLLHLAGEAVQDVHESLNLTFSAGEDVYARTLAELDKQFEVKANQPYERHVFRQMVQQPNETVAQFVTKLKTQAQFCNFQDHDDQIRDQLLHAMADMELREKLLEADQLTLSIAMEKSRQRETAAAQAKTMSSSTIHGMRDQRRQPQHRHYAPISESPASTFSRPAQSADRSSAAARAPRQMQNGQRQGPRTCYACGMEGHFAKNPSCPAFGKRCSFCGYKNHLASVCKKKAAALHELRVEADSSPLDMSTEKEDDSAEYSFPLNYVSADRVSSAARKPILLDVKINDEPLTMELDTGASFSVIPEHIWRAKWSNVSLHNTDLRLVSYGGSEVQIVGRANVVVSHNSQHVNADVFIVREGKYSLFGRDLLSCMRLNWPLIFGELHRVAPPLDVFHSFPEIFADELGCISDCIAKIHLREDAIPKCMPSRPVPYAIRAKVDQELDRLEKEGIIERVDFAEWASPIVIVKKKNGDIRLCADFKITINKYIDPQQHPIPNPTDLLSSLSGGQIFSKLDLRQAYAQLPLDEGSKRYCVISTHRGLYAYTRLPYGVSSAPSIWQRVIEQIVQGIKGVVVYFDDLLISGADRAEHDERMGEVLSRFRKYGVRVGREKCVFLQDQVQYLGYVVSRDGIQPEESKVRAIVAAPAPHDVQSLQSFLGMVNFYCRFVPNLSSLLAPLNHLLKVNIAWQWSHDCEHAFVTVKKFLSASPVLTHYRNDLPLVLEVDASPYGIGGCLFHVFENGDKKPVYFVSRSLLPAEKNYSQIDREALAIVFAVRRLHQFLYGRHFTLRTDHKPLLRILGEHTSLPNTVAARLQRWAVILASYDYTIEHIKGTENVMADFLSRLPAPVSAEAEAALIHAVNEFTGDPCGDIPLSATDVGKATADDSLLSTVIRYLQHGWPQHHDDRLTPYFRIRQELSMEQGVIFWNNRVVIPSVFQSSMLQELHSCHVGTSRMKSVARSFFWWPNLDADIVSMCASCGICQEQASTPTKEPLHPWVFPDRPFERVHIDFAEYNHRFYFILVDAYSKWLEVFEMGRDSTTSRTISCLTEVISRFGIPQIIVSDNGPQFTSSEFESFCAQNGIHHKRTPPYHPASNGQVERMVRELKKALRSKVSDVPIHTQLNRFLFSYRNTPHSSTGETPTKLLFTFTPTTRLSFLQPSFSQATRKQQSTDATPKRFCSRRFGVVSKPTTSEQQVAKRRHQKSHWASYVCRHLSGQTSAHACRASTIVSRHDHSRTFTSNSVR